MQINKMITPYNHASGTIDRITHIVLHYVGAVGSARGNCQYFMTDGRNASAHYFVDHDGSVWQSVEDKDIAWHCTNKNATCNNKNSIGIEMCCRKDGQGRWYFEDATVASAVELTKELMAKYNVPTENVWRHYDCTSKACPEPWVRDPSKWEEFKRAIGVSSINSTNGWFKRDYEWYYALGGEFAKNKWILYNKHWYRVGEDGNMLRGWNKVADKSGTPCWCYFEEEGEFAGAEWHERSDGVGFLERWTVDQENQVL